MIKAANYQEAQTILKKLKRQSSNEVVTWDAGDGWTALAYYCTFRKRVFSKTVNAEGYEVI